jgi:hypothetical protein
MMDETIVAVYDTAAEAEAAVRDLKAADVPADAISQHARTAPSAAIASETSPARQQGFWAGLFGAEPDHASVLDRSIESGSAVVTVRVVPGQHVSRVTDILERHNPVDLDDRASSYGLSDTTTTTRTSTTPMRAMPAATGDDTIQLAEETLSVGGEQGDRVFNGIVTCAEGLSLRFSYHRSNGYVTLEAEQA